MEQLVEHSLEYEETKLIMSRINRLLSCDEPIEELCKKVS